MRGRIRAEDLVDFHAYQTLKTWEIKIHPRELLCEILPCLSLGRRLLNWRRYDRCRGMPMRVRLERWVRRRRG